MSNTKATALFLFKSLGIGLQAANKVSCFESISIVECVPIGTLSFLMIEGDGPQVDKYAMEIGPLRAVRSKVFNPLDLRISESYYSLSNAEIDEVLVIIETSFIGDLFETAEMLLKENMKCVDIRMPRGSNSSCYLLMTGPAKPQSLPTLSNNPELTVNSVEKTSSALRDYFDIAVKG